MTRVMIQELKNSANEVVPRHHHLLPSNPRHLLLTTTTMDLDGSHHWRSHQDRQRCHSHPSSILHTISSIDAHNSSTCSFHGPHQKTLHQQAFIAPPWNHHLHHAPGWSKSGTASATLICTNQTASSTHLQWQHHRQPWMRNLHLKPSRTAAATRKNHCSIVRKGDHIAGEEEEHRPAPITNLAVNRATNAAAFPPSHQRASTVSETLILERESLRHVSASDCIVKLVKSGQLVNGAAKLVKSDKKVKDWSKERGLTTNIDNFGCLCKIGLQNWKWAI